MNTVTYTLNKTKFTFCQATGALVSLWNAGCGEIVKDGRGLIDIAWPVKYDYEILRAEPCGKHNTVAPIITADDRQITLHYPMLGLTPMPISAVNPPFSLRQILTNWTTPGAGAITPPHRPTSPLPTLTLSRPPVRRSTSIPTPLPSSGALWTMSCSMSTPPSRIMSTAQP